MLPCLAYAKAEHGIHVPSTVAHVLLSTDSSCKHEQILYLLQHTCAPAHWQPKSWMPAAAKGCFPYPCQISLSGTWQLLGQPCHSLIDNRAVQQQHHCPAHVQYKSSAKKLPLICLHAAQEQYKSNTPVLPTCRTAQRSTPLDRPVCFQTRQSV